MTRVALRVVLLRGSFHARPGMKQVAAPALLLLPPLQVCLRPCPSLCAEILERAKSSSAQPPLRILAKPHRRDRWGGSEAGRTNRGGSRGRRGGIEGQSRHEFLSGMERNLESRDRDLSYLRLTPLLAPLGCAPSPHLPIGFLDLVLRWRHLRASLRQGHPLAMVRIQPTRKAIANSFCRSSTLTNQRARNRSAINR